MDKYSADMVLLQDGNKLQTSMLNPGYLYNYTPKDYKEVLAKDDLEPTGAVYLNKVFIIILILMDLMLIPLKLDN